MIKPGYKTSEFWFTLVSFVFSGLFLMGILKDYHQKEELISVVSHAVESIILISGQLFIFTKYLNARKQEKIEHEKTKQKTQDTHSKELENYVGIGKNLKKININTANIGDLVQLPNIGPNLAQNIIDYRTQHGVFTSIEQVGRVAGIGESIYNTISPHIVLKDNNVNKRTNTKSSRNTNKPNKRVFKRPKKNSSE